MELCDGSTWTGEGSDDSHRTLSAQETQGRRQSSHTVQMRIEAQGGQVTQPRSHPSECWSWDCSRIRAHWRLGQQKYQVTQATCPGVEIDPSENLIKAENPFLEKYVCVPTGTIPYNFVESLDLKL